MTHVPYAAAVVTFRRLESLRLVLESIAAQVPAPRLTVVADNDPDRSAQPLIDEMRQEWPGVLQYVAVGANLGPAGGWARAVAEAQRQPAERGEWLLIVDDDDPLESTRVVQTLLDDAGRQPDRVAGIGLRGARLLRARGLLQRVEPPEGESAAVDYLASNGSPIYRWRAIDDVGFFEPSLFFGFEDLDIGLRMGDAGWQLRVAPHPSLQVVPDTSPTRSAWREYYKNRSLMWILSRRVGPAAVASTLMRSTVLGSARLLTRSGGLDVARARWHGSRDGLQGRLGQRRYHPSSNPAKPRGGHR